MAPKNCFSIQVYACPKKTVEELVADAIRLAKLLQVNVDFRFYGVSVSINADTNAEQEIKAINRTIDQRQYINNLSNPDYAE